MPIIGLAGYAGTGKDTVARIMQYINAGDTSGITLQQVLKEEDTHGWWLEAKSGWRTKSYAHKLKMTASLLTGIPAYKFNSQDFKKSNLGVEWGFMSVREFLQRLGTDAIRKGLHESTWVNALWSDFGPTDKWIITDVRFPDEAQAVKDRGGLMYRVTRSNVGAVNNHSSELALDHWKFDGIIKNDSTIEELVTEVSFIMNHLNFKDGNKTSEH